ncbi:uncharacterized protein BDW43DRAFT_294406 [Aspergillus alliaceus]|uniref:uncharacterized protein n=1 Tax=Petromyces alliaceus TaxID=209559 RepID=UPI0012A6699C|nr:uncharacterized protein BDW43DRAFT_294406 [Aspergillus alliaceus]KAB8227353.1 hypothetical protein BDW43DRAFT_294406 [Aspergillus alliaceus]
MGANAQYVLVYSPDGYVSAQIRTRADAEGHSTGPNGSLNEQMKHYIAYAGQFECIRTVDTFRVRHLPEVSSFPY